MAGQVVHVELPSEDVARAQEFWSGLMGWKFGDSGMPGIDYRMASTGDNSGVAIYNDDENRTGHPIIYMDVENIDESIERVRALGGESTDRSPGPGHGWFAKCRDTEGTSFSIWQSDSGAA